MLTAPTTRWTRVQLAGWYGGTPVTRELATGTAVWYQYGQPVLPLRWVLVRDPTSHTAAQALLSTDLALDATAIVGYYVRRWRVEVTFAEARRHLGVETQRQWADRAVARTTPILFSLFSLVTLLATTLVRATAMGVGPGLLPRQDAAWYPKPAPTFSDALALVRAHWWRTRLRLSSHPHADTPSAKIRRRFLHRLSAALGAAA